MNNPVSNSREAFELRQQLEKQVEEGTLTKESITCGARRLRERNKFYSCMEIHDDYMDKEGNLAYTVIHFKDANSDYHSFYINSYDNGFLTGTV